MTRLFLAAGVAALTIAVPAAAGPHGGGDTHGGGGGELRGGGNTHGGGAEFRGGGHKADRGEGPRMQRFEMRAEGRADRHQARRQFERFQMRVDRRQEQRFERRHERAERARDFERRAVERFERDDRRFAARALTDGEKFAGKGRGYGVGGCPPGLMDKGCMPPGLARNQQAEALRNADAAFNTSRLRMLAGQAPILAPFQAANLLGSPLSAVSAQVPLAALPRAVSSLYPETQQYYYRYGNGYVYQVDRSSNLISSLLPLLGGGFLPGTYLPQNYMSSFAPDYYGLGSFYPADAGDYGGYYGNSCNRYVDGVVYQIDCGSGLVRDVVPTYAGGYGVGQMLPSTYGYYNLPAQYRDLYQPTDDASYWYAPGAIYQVDPSSSLITSVAALLAPGLSVGQQLPAGYGTYNVPTGYRDTYYDTPNAWYRYNNGYIYQIDPTTRIVQAIVASLLG